jgi:acetyl esterase/lipase
MADPAIQKSILKAVLSLPPPILRAAAGGKAVYVGGRTLEPRFQFLLHAVRHYTTTEGLSDEKARETRAQQLALVSGRLEPGVRHEDLAAEGPRGRIPVRLYRHPEQDPALPLLVYAHDGEAGFEGCDAFCSILARYGHAPVLAVASQPTAERRFSSSYEDFAATFRWARDQAHRFGGPEGAAAVGGDSIGGGLAAILCHQLRQQGEPQPALQLLVYPWVDLSSETPSMSDYADPILPAQEIEPWAADRFLGPEDDPTDPRVSPLKAADVSSLAPAVVVTAGFDPLVDQGEDYARRLRGAGVPTVYRCYDHLVHGFGAFTGVVPAADVACREIAGLLREGLQGRIPTPH